jgi:anti-sigma regulatory factor (Ser/Thr protein kinase)
MAPFTASAVLNLAGLITGTSLYAILLVMVLGGMREERRGNPLALLSAVLGLVWNLGTFAAYGLFNFGLVRFIPSSIALSYAALCFLPSVVVQSALRNPGRRRVFPPLVFLAYAMSSWAALLHFHSAWTRGVVPSTIALRGLTVGYLVLTAILLFVKRGDRDWGRTLGIIALATFAVSTLHMSGHRQSDPWWLELIGHHASLPLVLAILYQDFRFALADIFLKRAVALIALVSLVFSAFVSGLANMLVMGDERAVPAVLALSVGAGLVYPWLRRAADWFVNTVVLRRKGYEQMVANSASVLSGHETAEGVLNEACGMFARALGARSCSWQRYESVEDSKMSRGGAEIFVPVIDPPYFVISIRELAGGRRLLSDDMAIIDKVALAAARRIDAVRTAHERCRRDLHEQEMHKLAAQAELRALRSQINPHFLFNTLTTIGYLIQTSPERALGTLLRFSALLRKVLGSTDEYVSVGEEMDLIEAYLDIERARFEDRLRVCLDVPWELRSLRIPALLIQPIVENALKHGVSKRSEGGEICIECRLDGMQACITVSDTGAGATSNELAAGRSIGAGLASVERRLACLGDPLARMHIETVPGAGTTVEVQLTAEWIANGQPSTISTTAAHQ